MIPTNEVVQLQLRKLYMQMHSVGQKNASIYLCLVHCTLLEGQQIYKYWKIYHVSMIRGQC